MTTFTNPVTVRDMKLIISGRTLGSLTDCSITGNGALADISTLGTTFKRRKRTFKNFNGTWTMWIEDMEALGWVLGDYQVDPTKEESVSVQYNGTNITINHIQGSHVGEEIIADTNRIAQKFVAAGNALTALKLWGGSGDTSATITIETDTTGSPSGTPVTNGTSTSTNFGGANNWVTVTFASDPVLVKGDVFWVVFTQTDVSATDIGVSTTNIYEDWGYKEYTGTWGSLQTNDLTFYIETTDNTTVLQVELTDGINTHIIEGNIVTGTGSFSITTEEPISAEVNYTAQDILFSG